MSFAKGDRVTWKLWDESVGAGECVEAESNGKVLVAVDPKVHPKDVPLKPGEQPIAYPDSDFGPAEDFDFHKVIYCATTWLEHELPPPAPTAS